MFCCLVRDPASRPVAGALAAVGRDCSPRVELYGEDVVVFDARGLQRVLGPPSVVAAEVSRLAAARGVVVHVALAGTMTAAWLLAHARRGTTVVHPGGERAALSSLPIEGLRAIGTSDHRTPGRVPSAERRVPDLLSVLSRWGVRSLGDLARLPRGDIRARLGVLGVRCHQAACGEDVTPLVPTSQPLRFVERMELEWPIAGLEPLAFVLARLCEGLSMTLERADRGAVAIVTRLRLVGRRTHERVLHLPAPMREARLMRTLILIDLEAHPPDDAVEVVEVELGVAPGRIAQGSLLGHGWPAPEDLATLIARLSALVGESRVGAPALVDTYDDREVDMQPFVAKEDTSRPVLTDGRESPCFRRFRLPVAARVLTDRGAPVEVDPAARGLAGGRVKTSAGPWRTSGRWWTFDRSAWNRDGWDVELANGGLYRLARDRTTGHWEIEGMFD
jgi:protein ImuB